MSMERRVKFELLYGEHAPAVKAYVLRRAQASVADDLVAEVFMVCWRRLDELPAEPLPWLLGVARRVLSTQRRGERRWLALHRRLAESGAAVGSLEATSPVAESLPPVGSLAPTAEALPPTAGSLYRSPARSNQPWTSLARAPVEHCSEHWRSSASPIAKS